MQTMDVIILGAGISGLTAACHLMDAGHEVLVLDRRADPGGRIRSERVGGFLMEHGPTSMVSPAPAAEDLIVHHGLARERIERGSGVRHRFLVRDGRVQALPITPHRFFSSSFFTLAGRARLLAEPFIPANPEDETIAGFVRRRFGAELLDYVFDPLVGGLFAGDPAALSVTAVFPELKRLEKRYGSVVGGVIRSRMQGGSTGPRFGQRGLFSFRDGLATLPRALAARLDGRLRLGVRAERITAGPNGRFLVSIRSGDERRTIAARSVVVALPAYAAARVLAPLDDGTATALAAIAHPPLAVVFLGYRAEDIGHRLDGLGVLTPARENRAILGALFSSTLFAGRAPLGHVALTAFVGGARQPDLARLPPADLVALVDGEVRALLGGRAAPVLSRVRLWAQGLPQLGLGHRDRLDALRALEERLPGLFVIGNYLGSAGTAACIERARAAAVRADAVLGERQDPLRADPAA